MLLDFTGELALWQVAILALVSLAVGVLGGFVGLALGTMRLPAMLLMGLSPSRGGRHQHPGEHDGVHDGRVPPPARGSGGLADRGLLRDSLGGRRIRRRLRRLCGGRGSYGASGPGFSSSGSLWSSR